MAGNAPNMPYNPFFYGRGSKLHHPLTGL